MDGIVSLLDTHHSAQVEQLWAELKREFGVSGVYITPFPHFSYHVAERYDTQALDGILDGVAATCAPFEVKASGLGIFNGKNPVLYIPVVRDARLDAVHTQLWPQITPIGVNAQVYYRSDYWLPHITIGFGDLTPASLGAISSYLAERAFNWTIPIDNFALIHVVDGKQQIFKRYPLRG